MHEFEDLNGTLWRYPEAAKRLSKHSTIICNTVSYNFDILNFQKTELKYISKTCFENESVPLCLLCILALLFQLSL